MKAPSTSRTGRVMQKERTRQALLAAARELIADGRPPSVAEAAKRASVSEPTAYRYYSSARSLLRDALVETRWPDFESVLAGVRSVPTAEARARIAAESMARNVLGQETHIRALIALSYTASGQSEAGDLRPAYRIPLIKAIMEALPTGLSNAHRTRLKLALSTAIGSEAVFSLKDSQKCSASEIISTMGWLASHIVSSASS